MQFQIENTQGMTLISTPLLHAHLTPSWFDLNWWKARDGLLSSAPGRGESYFLRYQEGDFSLELVWRHYKRGGLIARFNEDSYLWQGLQRSRPYRELALTAELYEWGLPVPAPLGARVQRQGLSYRCDLITQTIPGARPLDKLLQSPAWTLERWQVLGQLIRRFHDHGLDHVDLNVRNVLIDAEGEIYLIDFDQCRLRAPGKWQAQNLARFHRSLVKLLGEGQFADQWQALQRGYQSPG